MCAGTPIVPDKERYIRMMRLAYKIKARDGIHIFDAIERASRLV